MAKRSEETLLLPLRATMHYDKTIGKYIMINPQYNEVKADDVARFLIGKFGHTAIFAGEEVNS